MKLKEKEESDTSGLERELARIRERGEPLTLREMAPPPVPDAAWTGGSGREWSLVSHGPRPALAAALSGASHV